MRISACLIIRNEAANLRRCLESIRPHVDEICILDTGSTDESPTIAREYADHWDCWTGCNDADGRIMDFSAARNRNLAMATGGAVLWLDGDDVVDGAEHLRQLAREAPRGPGGAFAVLAAYEYDRDAHGRVRTLQWRERLVGPPSGFEWRGPVHEGLLAKAGVVPAHTQTDAFRLVHQREGKQRDPERNLRILRAWFAANGETDARLMHYYGAELQLNGQHGEAARWFRRHALMAPWSDERCLSLMHLARFHLAMGDGEEAARYATEAMTTKSWPEPMWLMGQAYCTLAEQGIDADHNLRRGAHFLESGLRLSDAPTLLMMDPTARYEACSWLSIAMAKLGRIEEAVSWAEKGLAGMPEHEPMRTNHRHWKAELLKTRIRESAIELHKLGELQRPGGQAIEAALRGVVQVESVKALSGRRLPDAGPSDKLDIVFFLGHQLEPWTPRTLEANGMGGSETMAWEMAKRLAALGHTVRVFAHTDKSGSAYDGVRWFDEADFYRIGCDVLISSRRFDAVHRARYKAAVLWVHDVHVGDQFTPNDAAKFDLIWCLSQWHRGFFLQCYPWCPPGKVEVTRNGIDLDRFRRADIERNPHRAIYSSSPDRGLVTAVRAWPEVRKLVPDAELHVYYGLDGWRRSLELAGENGIPWCSRASLRELESLLESTPGVTMHGRINQKRLSSEMMRSGVWCSPTWFSETSCITAMEAQAAGLHIVTSPVAALCETVIDEQARWVPIDGDLVGAIVSAMGETVARSVDVSRFSLDTLAADWDKRLRALVDAVVPAFSEAAQ